MSAEGAPPPQRLLRVAMVEQLTCAVCLGIFKDPLLLPCGHSLCALCAKACADTSTLRCPECRAEAPAGDDLRPSVRLRGLSDQLRRAVCASEAEGDETSERSSARRSSLLLCDLCEDDEDSSEGSKAVEANVLCLQCALAYCDACAAAFHPRRGALKRHTLLPAYLGSRRTLLLCAEHSGQRCDWWCSDCEAAVCAHCAMGGHREHATRSGATMCDELADKAERCVDEVEARCSKQAAATAKLVRAMRMEERDATMMHRSLARQGRELLSSLQAWLQRGERALQADSVAFTARVSALEAAMSVEQAGRQREIEELRALAQRMRQVSLADVPLARQRLEEINGAAGGIGSGKQDKMLLLSAQLHSCRRLFLPSLRSIVDAEMKIMARMAALVPSAPTVTVLLAALSVEGCCFARWAVDSATDSSSSCYFELQWREEAESEREGEEEGAAEKEGEAASEREGKNAEGKAVEGEAETEAEHDTWTFSHLTRQAHLSFLASSSISMRVRCRVAGVCGKWSPPVSLHCRSKPIMMTDGADAAELPIVDGRGRSLRLQQQTATAMIAIDDDGSECTVEAGEVRIVGWPYACAPST